ncbi:hypothetical protein VOLCADRAFT_31081, partial [Volvox carteri f. nagariensis]
LSAWAEFELHPDVLAGLAACGFTSPTPIQRECLHPAIRARVDIIGAAQTGSGKTLAFGLPIMHKLAAERAAAAAADMDMEAGSMEEEGQGEEGGTSGGVAKEELEEEEEAGMEKHARRQSQRQQQQRQQKAQRLQLQREKRGVVETPKQRGKQLQRQVPMGPAPQPGPLRALILTPTRELALQVCSHLQVIGRVCGVRVAAIVGGISDVKQARLLAARPAVLVATPGRLWDLIPPSTDRHGPRAAAHLADLTHLSFLVLDEADRMVAQGHYKQQQQQQQRGKKHLLQTFVFSATLTLPLFLKKRLRRGGGGAGGGAATLESLMDRVPFRTSPPPRVVDLTPQRRLADRVAEAAVNCLDTERDEVLYYLLAVHPGRTLVFANAVSAIRRVAALLKALGLPALALHAQQQQRQRLKALDRFRSQPQSVLVATDVAARGLDIPGVTTVVHYQLPASADTYIHRCGRTARGLEGDGISIALVSPAEAARFAGLGRVLGR